MNGGSSVFLIFLLIIAAFAGLGYLVPEIGRQAQKIQDLQRQNEELRTEMQILHNQNEILGKEAEAAQIAVDEAQAENQNHLREISILQNEITVAKADLKEGRLLLVELQQNLEIEQTKNHTLLTEKTNLETKLNTTEAKNLELSNMLHDIVIVNQELQDENISLYEQLDTKVSFQDLFPTDKATMSSLFNLVPDKNNWIFFPPILLAITLAGGYRYQRKNRGKQNRTNRGARVMGTKSAPLKNSEMVTIRIPRESLHKYIKWLRQKS